MGERKLARVWWVYLLLGVLLTSAYFFVPASTPRDLLYDVVVNVVGLTTIAMILVGIRVYRPARSLPWQLFVVGLLLLVAGDVYVTVNELLGRKLSFPTPADAAYLASYPFLIAGMLVRADKKPGPHEEGGMRGRALAV